MRQAQINVRTRACSRTSIARTKQAALTHNVRGKELKVIVDSGLLMDHRKNENCLVLEQKVLFDRSWKLKLLSAHSEFLIYG